MNSKQLVIGKFKVAQNGKSRGGGGEVVGQEPILAPITNIDNI